MSCSVLSRQNGTYCFAHPPFPAAGSMLATAELVERMLGENNAAQDPIHLVQIVLAKLGVKIDDGDSDKVAEVLTGSANLIET